MTRRDLLALSGSVLGVLATSRPGSSQQPPATARVGWLAHGDTMPRQVFEEALARLGWLEGKNLVIERRFAGSAGERLEADAAELVALQPNVIVAMGGVDAVPLLRLTRSTPIVIVTVVIRLFLALRKASQTGTSSITTELLPKLLELTYELVPDGRRVSILGDPRNPSYVKAAQVLDRPSLTVMDRAATRPEELDMAFAAAAAEGDSAVILQFMALTFEERWRIAKLATRYRLPGIYPLREYAEAGGLISYGPAIKENFERSAVLVDKILRGEKPSDLPFERPTHFELVVNQKAAKGIDFKMPPSLLARADQIIE